jgi:glutamate:Na+ symporter, ESS family
MELTVVENLLTLRLDLVMTLALAAVFLFLGYFIQRRIGFLRQTSIPAAILGGLIFALIVFALRMRGALGIQLDTSLVTPLQIAFFSTIGFSATLSLLRAGGWRAVRLWLVASFAAVVQNGVGIVLAFALGVPLALGVICGSLTLTGGPATGRAFADQFEQLGIIGAGTLIIASATFGICAASLVGNPIAVILIRRRRLNAQREMNEETALGANEQPEDLEKPNQAEIETEGNVSPAVESTPPLRAQAFLRTMLIMLIVMGAGALLGSWLARMDVTLPATIGAMIFAAIVRNLDDRFGWFKIDARAIEVIGTVALALFLVIVTMDLRLWQLAGLAVPMLVILMLQVLVMILYVVLVTFMIEGRDYEAAVTASGHIGFGLGVTPNAVANMEALTARFGPAPRSFLTVPIIGAFFIDLSNGLIITLFLNWLR